MSLRTNYKEEQLVLGFNTSGKKIVWQIEQYGKRFKIIRRGGWCDWHKITFYWINGKKDSWKTGKRFYWIEKMYDKKNIPSTATEEELQKGDFFTRKEYFLGKLERIYLGNQTSFIEFCCLIEKYKFFPTKKRFQTICTRLGLTPEMANLYIEFYKQFYHA